MEINESVLLIIFSVLFFILFIWAICTKKIRRELRKEKKRLEELYYPDLSVSEKKYRRTSISNYYRYHFKELSKFYLAIPYLTVITMILMIVCIFHVDTWGTWGIWLCSAIIMIFFSLYEFLTPSLEKQQDFWKDYLKKNPDNPLKVVLFPIEKNTRALKLDKITAVYFLFFGIYTLFMAIILFLNWYN